MKRISLLFLSILSGCAGIRPAPHSDLVKVDDIVGSIKCALSQSLLAEQKSGHKRLEGRVAKLDLDLQIVVSDDAELSAKASASKAGPFVFAINGGVGSILPSASGSIQRTDTINSKSSSRYLLTADDAGVCNNVDAAVRKQYGFSDWLTNTISGYNANADYKPSGVLDDIIYDGSFGVKSTGKAGLDLDVVFFNASASASTERNDIQHITLTITAPTKDIKIPNLYDNNNVGRAAPGLRKHR